MLGPEDRRAADEAIQPSEAGGTADRCRPRVLVMSISRLSKIEAHSELAGAISTESLWQRGRQYAKGAGVANI